MGESIYKYLSPSTEIAQCAIPGEILSFRRHFFVTTEHSIGQIDRSEVGLPEEPSNLPGQSRH